MPKKKKKKKFRAVKEVKAMAREVVGRVRSTEALPDPKKKRERSQAKHKPTLGKLLAESE